MNNDMRNPLLVVEGDRWVTLPNGSIFNLGRHNVDVIKVDGGRIVACVGGETVELYRPQIKDAEGQKTELMHVMRVLVGTPPSLNDLVLDALA